MPKFNIPEEHWNLIYKFFLTQDRLRVFDEQKLRVFVEAVFYLLRTGCQWRMLPAEYGNWKTIFSRFNDWSKKGIWEKLQKYITKNESADTTIVDATINRAHACSSGYKKDGSKEQGLGKSCGGHTTKINAIVNENGTLLDFKIVPGNENDIVSAQELIEKQETKMVLADKAYDCNRLIDFIKEKGAKDVIPPRINRKEPREYNKTVYKGRCIIEIFFWCFEIL